MSSSNETVNGDRVPIDVIPFFKEFRILVGHIVFIYFTFRINWNLEVNVVDKATFLRLLERKEAKNPGRYIDFVSPTILPIFGEKGLQFFSRTILVHPKTRGFRDSHGDHHHQGGDDGQQEFEMFHCRLSLMTIFQGRWRRIPPSVFRLVGQTGLVGATGTHHRTEVGGNGPVGDGRRCRRAALDDEGVTSAAVASATAGGGFAVLVGDVHTSPGVDKCRNDTSDRHFGQVSLDRRPTVDHVGITLAGDIHFGQGGFVVERRADHRLNGGPAGGLNNRPNLFGRAGAQGDDGRNSQQFHKGFHLTFLSPGLPELVSAADQTGAGRDLPRQDHGRTWQIDAQVMPTAFAMDMKSRARYDTTRVVFLAFVNPNTLLRFGFRFGLGRDRPIDLEHLIQAALAADHVPRSINLDFDQLFAGPAGTVEVADLACVVDAVGLDTTNTVSRISYPVASQDLHEGSI